MNDQIYQDLKSLHLSGMAQSWMLLHETRKLGELTLQDGMAVLIQAEHDQRTNNRTARLLSQARFRYNASIEELAFNTAQGSRQKPDPVTGNMRIHKTRRICTCDRPGRSREKLHRFRFGISGLLRRIQGQIGQYAETPGGYAYGKNRIQGCPGSLTRWLHLYLLIIDDFGMKILDGQQLLDFNGAS